MQLSHDYNIQTYNGVGWPKGLLRTSLEIKKLQVRYPDPACTKSQATGQNMAPNDQANVRGVVLAFT